MKYNLTWRHAAIIVSTFFFAACQKDPGAIPQDQPGNPDITAKKSPEKTATVTVLTSGLNNPRGLKFGPDGNLYVAEGGTGGTNPATCDPVIPPVGPYLGSETGGRISMVTMAGMRTTITDQLPSSQTSALLGTLISGVADIEFIGNTMYALLGGAGCSHGVANTPNGIVKVNMDGSWELLADLSSWQKSHPVAQPEEDDFEPDGTWYSMINVRGDLYAVEPNHGEIVKVTTNGDISRVIDISASQGHIVPTAITFHGNFYVGNLQVFPIEDGSSSIYKITPSGQIKVWATGFSTILGVVFDNRDRMYVLENTYGSATGDPMPGHGRIIRVSPDGTKEVIASELNLPTAMTMGPDGNLYVSAWGFGPPPIGMGQVLRVSL